MRTKTWIVLALVTVLAVAGAVYVIVDDKRHEQTDAAVRQVLFPGLMAHVNDVARLSFAHRDQTWTLVRGADGAWTMPERHDYAGSADKVKQAIVALADLRVLEEKTADPSLYDRIGVGDPTAAEAEAVLVSAKDATGADLAALIVGRTRTAATSGDPAQVYVRKPDEKRSWLVEARLDIKTDPLEWLDGKMVKVEKGRVVEAAIRHADGEEVLIRRDQDAEADFTLVDMPSDRKLRSTQRVGAIAAGLEFLVFRDVKPYRAEDFGDKAARATFRTREGVVYTVETLVDGEDHWAHITAEVDEAAIPADGDKAAAMSEAADVNDRLGQWAYLIPDYRAENFLRRMDALTEPKDDQEEAPAGETEKKKES